MTRVLRSSGRWLQAEKTIRMELIGLGLGWWEFGGKSHGEGRALREKDRGQMQTGRKEESRCWGRQDCHGPFLVSWFNFTNVSNVGNVCDMFFQNSR